MKTRDTMGPKLKGEIVMKVYESIHSAVSQHMSGVVRRAMGAVVYFSGGQSFFFGWFWAWRTSA